MRSAVPCRSWMAKAESECWAQTEAESGCKVQLRADPEWRRQNQNAERIKKLSQDAKCSSVQIVDGEG